jgi:sporulation protein YlmC with PRC-barrel domain
VNWLDGALDGVLHLLDRQVVDVDGRMVCKVDDVELTEWEDGTLAMTGLLMGGAALVPRLGGGLGRALERKWVELGIERAYRDLPGRIDLADVEELTSGVRLQVSREGLIEPQGPAHPGTRRRRLNDLLGMEVSQRGGQRLGRVLDVRMEPEPDGTARRILLTALVVGRGRPGSMLGYDRSPDQGPFLLNRIIRWVHRHSGLIQLSDVESLDWDNDLVTTTGGLGTLDHARSRDEHPQG